MSTKTLRDKQEDMVDEAVSALANLIPTPETIWGGISKAKLKAADSDTMREICKLSYDDFNRFQQAIEPAARRMDIVLLVRAVVLKAEASKIDGFLAGELEALGIAIANNTAPEIALNAAVYRLMTRLDDARPDNKYRVSRNAKAMNGIEITCKDAGVPISFATAGEILSMVDGKSRSELCKLVDGQTKLDAQNAVKESASSQAQGSAVEQQSVSETDAGSDGNVKPAKEAVRQTVPTPPIVPDLATEQELPALLDPVTVDALPETDLHLVAAVRVGQNLVLKGVVCSGAEARALIQKAMAG